MKDTTHSRILQLFSDGKKHHSNEICQPWIGGRQGISRICELRKKGINIQDEPSEGKGNVYWIPKKAEQAKLLDVKPSYYL